MTEDARIGPNAITRLAEALRDHAGDAAARHVFESAGLFAMLDAPPERMVRQDAVVRLYAALAREIPGDAARLAAEAGRLTADYLLARRIPKPAQFVLKRLPPALAAPLLLKAIGGNAWTFAGDGDFSWRGWSSPEVTVANGPFARPGAARDPLGGFYGAVFGRLFRVLVSPSTQAEAIATDGRCVVRLRRSGASASSGLRNAAAVG